MPYIVNPNDPSTPTNDQGATQGAEELRALKAVVAGLVVAALAAPTVRQAIQSSNLDSNGLNNAITVGAGLRPGLLASVGNEYQLSTAAGFSGGKAVDFNESFNANIADLLGADLPLSNTSYLYRNYGVGWGTTLVPPTYGYAFDRGQAAILNFEGLNGAVTTTDDFGNTVTFTGNAQLTTAQSKFGGSSLLCDGNGDKVSVTTVTSTGDSSWELSHYFRINALPGIGTDMMMFYAASGTDFGINLRLNNTAGTTKLSLFLSSTGAAFDIANATLGANTVWALNQWNKVRLVFDALNGAYKIFLSLNGALETLDINVASALKICAFSSGIHIGDSRAGGATGFNGWIDAFRFIRAVTNTSVEVPTAAAPAIGDYKHNFLSIPAMKMFEATAASAVAGTNPILTNVNRLFIGEADTSGVAVTAVRNYALLGTYVGPWINTLQAAATQGSASHNLGVTPANAGLEFENLTAQAGWAPGDRIPSNQISQTDATQDRGMVVLATRNSVMHTTYSGGNFLVPTKTTGVAVNLTAANWRYRYFARRGW